MNKKNLSKTLTSNPHQRDIRKDIGYAYFHSGNSDDALKFLREEIKLFPDNGDALTRAIDLYGNEPENPEIKLYFDCSLKKPDSKRSPLDCSLEIHLSRKFIDEPEREYKYRLKKDIHSVIENINYLGLEFIRRGKLHEALRRYRNGLKIYPESPEINFNMGMVFFWLNYLKEAEKYTLRALREKDYFGRLPTYRKQEILKKEGARGIETRRTFDVALNEGNYFLDAYDHLGNIHFKMGDFDKSIRAYKKVIEIDPEDAIGYYNLGWAYAALKDWKSAEMEWKKSIEYEKESRKREKKGEVSDDDLKFSLIVVKRPVSFRAHKSLGKLYMEQSFWMPLSWN